MVIFGSVIQRPTVLGVSQVHLKLLIRSQVQACYQVHNLGDLLTAEEFIFLSKN